MSVKLRFTAVSYVVAVLLSGNWLGILAGNAGAQQAESQAAQAELVVDGQPVPLAEDVSAELGRRADTIVRNCSYDGGDRSPDIWRDALSLPSAVRLVYSDPIQVTLPRRRILVSQAVFSLGNGSFLEQPVFHHEGHTIAVAKCDGMQMLKLMCMTGLKSHFPPAYQRNCEIVRAAD